MNRSASRRVDQDEMAVPCGLSDVSDPRKFVETIGTLSSSWAQKLSKTPPDRAVPSFGPHLALKRRLAQREIGGIGEALDTLASVRRDNTELEGAIRQLTRLATEKFATPFEPPEHRAGSSYRIDRPNVAERESTAIIVKPELFDGTGTLLQPEKCVIAIAPVEP